MPAITDFKALSQEEQSTFCEIGENPEGFSPSRVEYDRIRLLRQKAARLCADPRTTRATGAVAVCVGKALLGSFGL